MLKNQLPISVVLCIYLFKFVLPVKDYVAFNICFENPTMEYLENS